MPATPRADPAPVGPSAPLLRRGAIGASVDLGSNSVHLLVASVGDHTLDPVHDESVFLGLGSAVTERGLLGRVLRGELTAALVRYADSAHALGAVDVTFVGTEPIRRAADATAVVVEVSRATQVPVHVVSHEEEAYLTIVGVTEGRHVTRETLMIDIGGGSSEISIVDDRGTPRATGLRLGSASLTDRHVSHDPPEAGEIEAMYAAALAATRDAPVAHPAELVAVGGTASNLLKITPPDGSEKVLTSDMIAAALQLLGSMPASAAIERFGLNPARGRILPAGAAILAAMLERYEADQVRVSDAGIREGTILAVAHGGPAWRDRLGELAAGW